MIKLKAKNLAEYLEVLMQEHAEKPAFQCGPLVISYSELEKKSRQVACWLQSRYKKGDRIAVQLPNIIQYPIAAMGILRAGMTLVNTNPLYTPREMKHQFCDSGTKAIFILDSLVPSLKQIIDDTEIESVILVTPTDLLQEAPKNEDVTGYRLFDILNEIGTSEEINRFPSSSHDIALLQYTGGTTGVAKGACLTHKNILSNVYQIGERLKSTMRPTKEVFVCPLPLYHIYAFTVNMIYMTGIGNLNVLIPNPRDIDNFVKQLSNVKFTGLSGINTLFVGLCSHSEFKKLDFSGLRLTISGGTSLIPDVAEVWQDITGVNITEGYGLTETSPVAIFNTPGNEEIGSIGNAVLDTQIDIRNADGQSVKDGEPGELLIKGPQVMWGYWNKSSSTDDAFTSDGYFKTGDVAVKLESGNYRIVDRIKDMILVSGFNVYPTEVESVISSHPAVLEAAVVGGTSDKTGEEVLGFVTISGEASVDEIIAYCKEQLTAYKVPKKVTIMDALPKSPVGKILRKELRAD